MTQARIFIAVPIYNRREVVEQCVPTISHGMERPDDRLFLYDDGSTEYNIGELGSVGQDYAIRTESMGIDAQRRRHILEFLDHAHRPFHGEGPSFTHLYLTDSDSPHDPNWRTAALALHKGFERPICLYRTQTHADYEKNIYYDDPHEGVLWQRFFPGVSILMSLKEVEAIADRIPERWSWDWHLAGLLGYKMPVSRISWCDHIGHLGMHDQHERGVVSKERAVNPSAWLVSKRREILSNLGLKDA